MLARTPSVTSDSFDFVVIGDFGVGGERQGRVATAMQQWAVTHEVEAFVTTGDNIYSSGHPSAFENAWRRPYGWVQAADIPIVASLGNHDKQTDAGRPVMGLLEMPSPWYTRDFASIRFLVLDANQPGNAQQLRFISESVAPPPRWTIAVFHQPAFSCAKHGSTPDVQRLWLPLFRRVGVDLILNGHDHSYQRFATTPPAVVTGGGGATLYAIGRCPIGTPKPEVAFSAYNFLYVEASTTAVRVRSIKIPGSTIADDVTYPR